MAVRPRIQGAALVTGCSTGIGRATAVALTEAGFTVYATARRPETLIGLAETGIRALALDVTVAESRYRQALELAPADSPQRPGLLVRWARALIADGRMDAAPRAFDDGIAGLRSQGGDVATALGLLVALNAARSLYGQRRRTLGNLGRSRLAPCGPAAF